MGNMFKVNKFIYQRYLLLMGLQINKLINKYHWGGHHPVSPTIFCERTLPLRRPWLPPLAAPWGAAWAGVRDVGCRIYDIFIMGYYKVVPQFVSVQLVQITTISLWFMADITIVNGVYYGILVKSIYMGTIYIVYSCLIYLSDIFIMGYYIIYIVVFSSDTFGM